MRVYALHAGTRIRPAYSTRLNAPAPPATSSLIVVLLTVLRVIVTHVEVDRPGNGNRRASRRYASATGCPKLAPTDRAAIGAGVSAASATSARSRRPAALACENSPITVGPDPLTRA